MDNNDKQYEDDMLNDDLPGNNARYKLKHRNEVRLNYDSDSSLEDYRNEDKQITDNKGEESNDDMFASDEDNDEGVGDNEKDKIDDSETIGNLQHTETFEKDQFDDPVNEDYKLNPIYESDDDNEDNEDSNNGEYNKTKIDYYTNIEHLHNAESAAHPKHKLAPKIEAFDLIEEAEEGKFDESGNFVRNTSDNDNDKNEEWMDLKKSDIKRAKKAQLERNRLDRERRMKESTDEFIPIAKLLSDLIELLEPVETPMEALTRFSPPKKSRSRKKDHKNNENDQERKKTVIRLTEICDQLINKKGIINTYELTREELMRKYTQETGTDYKQGSRGKKRTREDDEDNSKDAYYGDKIWEFKWNGQDEIHGPFSEFEMYHWSKDYFQNNVVVRKINEKNFKSVINVNFDSGDMS
ncbi:uncharacterized protein AC631_03669 [Debaryomyces fabryi]|uniref:GYF domain-containing protein n=1 Tax=Debaryomyces fabryi TaxID=58627 RepID=A0A0V1PWE2_9ASCO|nr:uncharacterized protein AC631_03669 [Debaryomyces fabryi]KSA00574.1 hypothetical protein AC631_03669 [Debaryomyces fabryi]CUM45885.1 unnamed protein product [Debaryomyces fabryi]